MPARKQLWAEEHPEAYSDPFETSKMEFFVKILEALIIFAEVSILDVWKGSEYATEDLSWS